MKTKILFISLVCLTACIGLKAQEIDKDFTPYGYSKINEDTVLDPAMYAVVYRRSQVAINDATKEKEVVTDTLTLVIGTKWSVFYNAAYDDRYSAWGRGNIKKTRQSKKVIKAWELKTVPIASVQDKLSKGTDFMENNCGEPVAIYTDRLEGRTISCLINYVDNFSYSQNIKEFSGWTLAERQDSVLGHECMEATVHYAGRDYTAWYAPEIPISAGPWKLYGLPGLILKAEDSEGLFQFEAISIESLQRAYITIKDNLSEVKPEAFNKFADKEKSEIEGSFVFEGEFISTVSHPYTYFQMER